MCEEGKFTPISVFFALPHCFIHACKKMTDPILKSEMQFDILFSKAERKLIHIRKALRRQLSEQKRD